MYHTNKIKFHIFKRNTKIKILKKINLLKKKSTNLNNITVSIKKPKNQFYLNFFNNLTYTYSTGMVIRSLKLETRSIRRIRAGFYIFFSFFLKKFKNLHESSRMLIYIHNFNNINLLKNFLIKFFNKKNTLIVFKISKNKDLKNYKKISYINKRLRRKFPIE